MLKIAPKTLIVKLDINTADKHIDYAEMSGIQPLYTNIANFVLDAYYSQTYNNFLFVGSAKQLYLKSQRFKTYNILVGIAFLADTSTQYLDLTIQYQKSNKNNFTLVSNGAIS